VSGFKHPGFAERLKAAANAKKMALERYQRRSTADDPEFAERQAAKAAARVARDARAAALKSARAAQKLAQEAALQSSIEAEAAAHEAVIREQAARELDLKAEQKAGRDARYAARKARQR
jgi:hypothetical protein